MNIWAILEIEATTNERQIKRAYAKLIARYHPEEYPEKFQQIREAYEAALLYASRGTPQNSVKHKTPFTMEEQKKGEKEREQEPSPFIKERRKELEELEALQQEQFQTDSVFTNEEDTLEEDTTDYLIEYTIKEISEMIVAKIPPSSFDKYLSSALINYIGENPLFLMKLGFLLQVQRNNIDSEYIVVLNQKYQRNKFPINTVSLVYKETLSKIIEALPNRGDEERFFGHFVEGYTKDNKELYKKYLIETFESPLAYSESLMGFHYEFPVACKTKEDLRLKKLLESQAFTDLKREPLFLTELSYLLKQLELEGHFISKTKAEIIRKAIGCEGGEYDNYPLYEIERLLNRLSDMGLLLQVKRLARRNPKAITKISIAVFLVVVFIVFSLMAKENVRKQQEEKLKQQKIQQSLKEIQNQKNDKEENYRKEAVAYLKKKTGKTYKTTSIPLTVVNNRVRVLCFIPDKDKKVQQGSMTYVVLTVDDEGEILSVES